MKESSFYYNAWLTVLNMQDTKKEGSAEWKAFELVQSELWNEYLNKKEHEAES